MRYGSVCSGIEAATVAWHPLGWEPAWFAEIEKFPSAVLAHHYPNVPNRGDFTRIKDDTDAGTVDLLVGGTPCQSFSVAGLRAGLDDPRGNLALEFLRLADAIRPRWLVWENVPGVLTSTSGRPESPPPDRVGVGPGERVVVEDEYEEVGDFSCFLAALSELGYGWAYRVLDAQFFGVPQRRRRVFVVGYLGDWRPPVAVLLERESLSGNPPPRREAGAGVAPGAGSGIAFQERGRAGGRNLEYTEGVAYALSAPAGGGRRHEMNIAVPAAFQCHGSNVGEMGSLRHGDGNTSGGVPFIVNAAESCATASHARASEVARCIDGTGGFASSQGVTVVAQPFNIIGLGQQGRNHAYPAEVSGCLQHKGLSASGNEAGTLVASPFLVDGQNAALIDGVCGTLQGEGMNRQDRGFMVGSGAMAVRRLTPTECERLQGFPDGYTAIPWKGKPAESCPDGPRYKALGNSMAVPVMRWIGERIERVDRIVRPRAIESFSVKGKTRPPVKIFGGKYPIAGAIASLMPPHDEYVEPFIGGGSVLLAKPAALREFAYDADHVLIRMWSAIVGRSRDIETILGFAEYDADRWAIACSEVDHEDDAVAAASLIIRSRWSRGGMGATFGRSSRRRGGQCEYVNSWETFRDRHFPRIVSRVRDVAFAVAGFRDSIPRHDRPSSLLYLDPPYHPITRTAKAVYDHEMSDQDHRDLLDLVLASRAKVMLSGYRCPLYDDVLRDWNRADKDVANHSGQGRTKARRTESIWMNF